MTRTTLRYNKTSSPLRHKKSLSHFRNIRAMIIGTLSLLVTTLAIGGCASHGGTASGKWSSDQPIDQLTLLQEAADHEALYTLAGGLKPMSSGFWYTSFVVDDPDLRELHKVQEMLEVLQNEAWYADVQIFDKIHDGERNAHAFVVHRNSLARMIDRHESFWSSWDITPETHPTDIVDIVDRMPRSDRWRGYGYLYGYPDEAVDFFVEAGLAADDGSEMGPGKDRQFMQIPTYAAESGRFTYAVPLEHVPTPADQALKTRANSILKAYKERRPHIHDLDDMIETMLQFNDQFAEQSMIERIDFVAPMNDAVQSSS